MAKHCHVAVYCQIVRASRGFGKKSGGRSAVAAWSSVSGDPRRTEKNTPVLRSCESRGTLAWVSSATRPSHTRALSQLESGAGVLPAMHTGLCFSQAESLRQRSRQPAFFELTEHWVSNRRCQSVMPFCRVARRRRDVPPFPRSWPETSPQKSRLRQALSGVLRSGHRNGSVWHSQRRQEPDGEPKKTGDNQGRRVAPQLPLRRGEPNGSEEETGR